VYHPAYHHAEFVSASSGLLGRITRHWVVVAEGWESGEARPTVWVMMVDPDFISTMGMDILDILLYVDFGLYYSFHNGEFSVDQSCLCQSCKSITL
jgi:hypothetical protein